MWAVVVNLLLTVAQIAGGWLADSVALMADGVHNLSDAMALVLAFGARRLSRRAASPDYSYGWGRVEILAAFVNYLTLIGISIWLAVEAVMRLMDPPEVAGGWVMGLAALALVIDLATAALVWRASRDSVNIRAAFLHNLTDAGVSVAVILGGLMIWAFGWQIVDPILTIGISVAILLHIKSDMIPVMRMLMLASPPGIDSDQVLSALRDLPQARDAHHLHLWLIDEHRPAASVHMVAVPDADFPQLTRDAKALLADRFGISHATIEVETGQCADDRD